jgi:hypothetical protein
MDYPEHILGLKLGPNDAGAKTIQEYFRMMMHKLWIEGESFSGKRPFGNSGWEWPVYRALLDAELIKGTEDDFDQIAAHALVAEALERIL